jgi:hypothetical protein
MVRGVSAVETETEKRDFETEDRCTASQVNFRDWPAVRLEAQAGTGPTGGDDGAERADLRGRKRDVGETDDSRDRGGDGVHGVFDKLSSRKLKTRQGH